MRKDRFTDEALAQAKALAEVKMNDSESFSEAYDFARCKRLDGTFYGIPDGKQCKRGVKAEPAEPKSAPKSKKKSAKERMAAAYDKAQKSGGFRPKKDKAPTKKMKTDFRKEIEEGAARRKKREAEIMANQKRVAQGKKFLQRARSGIKRLEAQYKVAQGRLQMGRANKIMDAISRLRKQADKIATEVEKLSPGARNRGELYVG